MTDGALREQIASKGSIFIDVLIPLRIREHVIQRNWLELDRSIAREVLPEGILFKELKRFAEFTEIEFIISIRSSHQDPDEDGIWHDDGSRVLAFSLSLTLKPSEIEGGCLEIRKRDRTSFKSEKSEVLPTPSFGTIIVFATGHQGFEHKINRVIRGERLIIAGWCS